MWSVEELNDDLVCTVSLPVGCMGCVLHEAETPCPSQRHSVEDQQSYTKQETRRLANRICSRIHEPLR